MNYGMRREIEVAIGITSIFALHKLSEAAFTYKIRKEILERENYICEGILNQPCIWTFINGEPASWANGHFVMASHHNHQKNENYDNPDNGMCSCKACHMIYESYLGNIKNIQLLRKTTTMYHYRALAQPSNYKSVYQDIREVEDLFEIVMNKDCGIMSKWAKNVLNVIEPKRLYPFGEIHKKGVGIVLPVKIV